MYKLNINMKNLSVGKNSMVAQATNKPKVIAPVSAPLVDLTKEEINDLIAQCDSLHTNIAEKYNVRKYKQLNDAMITLSLVKSSLSKIN
jgi:hypothetical protein